MTQVDGRKAVVSGTHLSTLLPVSCGLVVGVMDQWTGDMQAIAEEEP